MVDLVESRCIIYTDDMGTRNTISEIPAEIQGLAAKYRTELIEAAAEFDEELMERYLEGKEAEPDMLRRAIREGTVCMSRARTCGTAARNKGIQLLLDAVVDYLPSP